MEEKISRLDPKKANGVNEPDRCGNSEKHSPAPDENTALSQESIDAILAAASQEG